MAERLSAEERAKRIFYLIPRPGEPPKTRATLARESGMSVRGVRSGIIWLRKRSPDLPLIGDRNGIYFSAEIPPTSKYIQARARTTMTQISLTITGVLDPLPVAPEYEAAKRRLRRILVRLAEDVSDLADTGGMPPLGPPPTPPALPPGDAP